MASTPPRSAERTRQRILAAAARVVGREGFEALSVNALAGEAGVGKPLLYRYFGGINGVRRALVEQALEAARREGEAPLPFGLPVSEGVYRMLRFGRMLAGNPLLRALTRALLAGRLAEDERDALLALLPAGEAENAPARALLLAGISYVVLLKDSCASFAGAGLDNAKELAKLEAVFARLAASLER